MNFLEKSWKLAAGRSVSLRYRVLLFAGDPKEAEVERIYQAGLPELQTSLGANFERVGTMVATFCSGEQKH